MIEYINGEFIINSKVDSMHFKCTEDTYRLLLRRIKYLKADYIEHFSSEVQTYLDFIGDNYDKESRIKSLKIMGYEEIFIFNDATLYAANLNTKYPMASFAYVSDELPNKHGSTVVNAEIGNIELYGEDSGFEYTGTVPTDEEVNHVDKPIDKFRGDYFFLSNSYEETFNFHGIKFYSVEAAFQSEKSLDGFERVRMSAMKPSTVKSYGHKVNQRPYFKNNRVKVMQYAVICKFVQNGYLMNKLVKTGETRLIDGNTCHDNFWGVCQCGRSSCNGGKNMLGKILMKVRETYKKDPNRLLEICYYAEKYGAFPDED